MENLGKATVLALVATLALAGGAAAQVDFSKYVALGDSATAGFSAGALTQYYQTYSYPAILNGQFGGATFEQPIVSDPGIGSVAPYYTVLQLTALNLTSQGVSPVIGPTPAAPGQPTNATYQGVYNNLGIPGANAADLLTKTGDITKLLTGNIDPNTVMYDIILRDGINPAINQAIGAEGTFYTVWIGINDVLGAAASGVAVDGVTLTPVQSFQTSYTTILGALLQNRPGAVILTANIPDVTVFPFVTTVKPYLVNPADGSHIPLIGEAGPLSENDYVTLGASSLIAQGIGVPVAAGGTGIPLPEGKIDATGLHAGVILRAGEVALISQRVGELNAVIAAVAGQLGVPMVDVNGRFLDIKANGYELGGVTLTPVFLTGGIFSYDGIHPQRLGYAIVADEFVKVINAELGTDVPRVDLRRFLFGTLSTTSVSAANTIYGWDAFKGMVKLFSPNAVVDDVNVRRPRTRTPLRAAPEPARTGTMIPK
jgi:lysophospholipase L1-like esterase